MEAISLVAQKDIVVTDTAIKLCDRLDTGRDFYEMVPDGEVYRKVARDVKLRTFDDMVHFVGETLRKTPDNASENQTSSHGLCLKWSKKSRGAECEQRFFQVRKRSEITGLPESILTGFGVEVQHAGSSWRVLPQVSLKDVGKTPTERTGTVLSILSQIYLLNQSSEFLEAPENLLLQ